MKQSQSMSNFGTEGLASKAPVKEPLKVGRSAPFSVLPRKSRNKPLHLEASLPPQVWSHWWAPRASRGITPKSNPLLDVSSHREGSFLANQEPKPPRAASKPLQPLQARMACQPQDAGMQQHGRDASAQARERQMPHEARLKSPSPRAPRARTYTKVSDSIPPT